MTGSQLDVEARVHSCQACAHRGLGEVRIGRRSEVKNSSAEANAFTANPTDLIKPPKGFTDGVIIVDNRNKRGISHADLSMIESSNV